MTKKSTAKQSAQKRRTEIPKTTRAKVLREFSHLCAACARRDPELHHIDGDHNNHDPLNLIPLCSNDHRTEAHNPTQPIKPGIYTLLRIYHDPTVLDPRFQPLFHRIESLRNDLKNKDYDAISQSLETLCRFVGALEMGAFFSQEIARTPDFVFETDEEFVTDIAQHFKAGTPTMNFALQPDARINRIECLIMEALRYQNWLPKYSNNAAPLRNGS